MQQVSRSDQGWRRRLPSGTSAAMSARERLEAQRRIERLLDEDWRRVAPPPEKATTPVGWLDHERRRCSLEGAATTSSFGSVDDERRRTAGRRKPILDRKKNSSSRRTLGYNLECTYQMSLPFLILSQLWSTTDRKRRERARRRGSSTGGGATRAAPLLRPCSSSTTPEAAPAAATLRTAARR